MDIRELLSKPITKRQRPRNNNSPPKKLKKVGKKSQPYNYDDGESTVIESSDEEVKVPKRQQRKYKSTTPNRARGRKKATSRQRKASKSPMQELNKDIKSARKSRAKSHQPASELPLSGKTFVITGILPQSREEITDTIKELGGRVTGQVSSRTTYLLYGEKLENGNHYTQGAKYKKAIKLGTELITYKQFEDLVQQFEKKPIEASPQIQATQIKIANQPWTEIYKPKNLKQLVGNQNQIKELIKWLEDWEDVIINGNKKEVKYNRFKPEKSVNLNAAAALISGPPGIGKTSCVRILAKGLCYNPLEFNASDCRSQKLIKEIQDKVSNAKSLNASGSICKTLLIMDEVDGMSSGDRGGLGAIVNMIKTTKVPIICICNDRQSQKLKTLANYCLDLKFARPNKLQVSNRIQDILQQEGVQYEKNAIEKLIENSGNDIRQVIGICEMLARTGQPISYKMQKEYQGKDANVFLNNFDAAGKLLRSYELKNLSFKEKMDLFFIDYELIPLLVNENYLDGIQENWQEAAELQAFSDVLNFKIRGRQEWSLLQSYGFFSSVSPGILGCSGIGYTKFPEFFGKLSKQNKNARLIREIKHNSQFFADNGAIISDYVPLIWNILMEQIESKNVEEIVETMHEIGITPEILKEHLIALQQPSKKFEQQFKNIDTKLKTQISKTFNSIYKDSVQKIKKSKSAILEQDQVDPEVNDIQIEDEEEELEEISINRKEYARRGKSAKRGKRGKK